MPMTGFEISSVISPYIHSVLLSTSTFFLETIKNTKTFYCFMTKGFLNVKSVSCISTTKGVVGNKFNFIAVKSSITSGISNMG